MIGRQVASHNMLGFAILNPEGPKSKIGSMKPLFDKCSGYRKRFSFSSAALTLLALTAGAALTAAGDAPLRIARFEPEANVCRAGRPEPLVAELENLAGRDLVLRARVSAPAGVRVAGATQQVAVASGNWVTLRWQTAAAEACGGEFALEIETDGQPAGRAAIRVCFLPPLPGRPPGGEAGGYIPDPQPAPTDILVGAHHCPLWESDKPNMWLNVLKHPERTPALGFYSQENPEVADWETKWAVEHGISFFIYCWYRAGQGGPVKMNFGSGIHDALLKSRFVDRLKFTIMWENQSRGQAGVADEGDLMRNLLPFWMENYFKHPGYLKVDNKPVLFIYRPEFLADDLGGVANVAKAFAGMRQACREQGFDGLYLLGEYRGLDPNHLKLMRSLGLDYTFAYCWHVGGSPTPERASQAQMHYIRQTQALSVLPQVVTVSQAWSGWQDEGSIWKIPPADFERLLGQARDFIGTLPKEQLGSRMLLLDNWNEWGEGHYIAPYREYGFGYLDAVRKVFSSAPPAHVDLLPGDIGRGPYDRAIRGHFEREAQHRILAARAVFTPGAPAGLVGRWTFDEEPDSPVAFDHSGRRHGATLLRAARAPGLVGSALRCDGGCAVVPAAPHLTPSRALTVACWVQTDTPAQDNRWLVNRVFGGATATGYRLGVLGGHPCFEIPLTDWSHHLKAAAPLPVGRWVHLAGTFDGATMRIYVDGTEQGALERPGPLAPNGCHLVLGNYEVDHAAHFSGLLDDVRLYDRALTAAEVLAHGAEASRAADSATVGAIRWDAWHAPATNVAHGASGGPVKAMEASLDPARYRQRAPFFARVDAQDRLHIDGYTQEVVDREIGFARAGGIDYWAFLLYDEGNVMSQGLSLYLRSARKREVRFCAIAQAGVFGAPEAWPKGVERLVRLMQDPCYQTVCGTRPLLYLFRIQDEQLRAWGGTAGARRLFDGLRQAAKTAGLGDPYLVVMDYAVAQARRTAEAAGAEALSDYACSGNAPGAPYAELAAKARAFWGACAATGSQVVPLAMAGWDRRPRVEHPVPWETWQEPGVGLERFYVSPTPGELAGHLDDALAWARARPAVCPAQTVLVYAWNEHDEGGWLCPTRGADGNPDASRLAAIAAMRGRDENRQPRGAVERPAAATGAAP